ncbi:MAG: hypothetical protein VYC38_07440 [Pseudomonadota bacterium]|nr:hypothetical protein [Pseudomonadota bacterium]
MLNMFLGPCDSAGRSLVNAKLSQLVAIALIATPMANACVKVRVVNDTDTRIKVMWTATPCMTDEMSIHVQGICESHHVDARGHSRSFEFGWGATDQGFAIAYPGRGATEDRTIVVKYGYSKKHNDMRRRTLLAGPHSPAWCPHHYTVHYTQQDLDKDLEKAAQDLKG